jgi:NAD(P)-dependent dehydrogenase (short-subunit alcohol dehydrogenase family)
VGLIARGKAALAATREEIDAAGGTGLAVPADVADADAVEAAAARIEDELGPIEVWVNCAMATIYAPVWETDPVEFRRAIEVSFLGYVHGTMAALRRMRPRDRGTIVQVGSALAYRAIPLQAAYCSAKHAIEGFTESLRCELLHERSAVRLTMVQLPALNTTQFETALTRLPRAPRPVAPVYEPEVAAQAIALAADEPRRELWVGRSTVAILALNKLAPGPLDRYLARTGFASQQTDEPARPDRPHALWEPVGGDRGARGPFSGEAASSSLQLRALHHRRGWALAAVAAAGAALAQRVRARAGASAGSR